MAPSIGQASRHALQETQSSATMKYQVVVFAFCPSPFLMQSTGHTSTQDDSPSQMSFTISYAMHSSRDRAAVSVDLQHPVERDARPLLRLLGDANRVHDLA